MPTDNTQSVSLSAPDGGEIWTAGELRSITWTATHLAVARIEYRKAPGEAWQHVADVEGYRGSYGWTVPADATTEARVRVADLWDAAPVDSSNATFQILAPILAASPDTLEFGAVLLQSRASDSITVSNPGTSSLHVDVAVTGSTFALGATAMVMPAGESRRLGVTFQPASHGPAQENVTLTKSAPGPEASRVVVVRGTGATVSDAGDVPRTWALSQDGPNPFRISTRIRYRLPRPAIVRLDVFDSHGRRVVTLVRAEQAAGEYVVPFGPGAATASGGRLGPLASGVYFARLQAGAFERTHKLVLAP